MLTEFKTCDVCKPSRPEDIRPVETYTIREGDREGELHLCAEHCGPMEAALPARRGRRPAHMQEWAERNGAAEAKPARKRAAKKAAKKAPGRPRAGAKKSTTTKKAAAKKAPAARVTPVKDIPNADKVNADKKEPVAV